MRLTSQARSHCDCLLGLEFVLELMSKSATFVFVLEGGIGGFDFVLELELELAGMGGVEEEPKSSFIREVSESLPVVEEEEEPAEFWLSTELDVERVGSVAEEEGGGGALLALPEELAPIYIKNLGCFFCYMSLDLRLGKCR